MRKWLLNKWTLSVFVFGVKEHLAQDLEPSRSLINAYEYYLYACVCEYTYCVCFTQSLKEPEGCAWNCWSCLGSRVWRGWGIKRTITFVSPPSVWIFLHHAWIIYMYNFYLVLSIQRQPKHDRWFPFPHCVLGMTVYLSLTCHKKCSKGATAPGESCTEYYLPLFSALMS